MEIHMKNMCKFEIVGYGFERIYALSIALTYLMYPREM
jgi:hypothetical protein